MSELNRNEMESAHLLAGPHAHFCVCMAAIHQQPLEVRRAALEELLAAVHGALAKLDKEEETDRNLNAARPQDNEDGMDLPNQARRRMQVQDVS